MAKGSSTVQEKVKVVKKKTRKARLNKDDRNSPQHGKVEKASSENGVHRILHAGAQRERNVAQQINKKQDQIPLQTAPAQISEVTKRAQAQVGQRKSTRYFPLVHQKLIHISKLGDQVPNSPALERLKKFKEEVLRKTQYSSATSSIRNKVPLRSTQRSTTMPHPLTCAANQDAIRTKSRAQAFLSEMTQQSPFKTLGPQEHGLFALATELPPKQKFAEVTEAIVTTNYNVPGGEGEGINNKKDDITQTVFTGAVWDRICLQEGDVTQSMMTEVTRSTELREVSFSEDWRPGSYKLDKPSSADKNPWLRVEMEEHHELRLAQNKATREKDMRDLTRIEGAGVNGTNITPPSKYSSQPITNSIVREDVEESARGHAKFSMYGLGAAGRDLGLVSASSSRSFGPPETEPNWPKSGESGKSTTEMILAITLASTRREAMRKELAKRFRKNLRRKEFLILENRAASRAQSHCKCY